VDSFIFYETFGMFNNKGSLLGICFCIVCVGDSLFVDSGTWCRSK
jgi:hypothetical protein